MCLSFERRFRFPTFEFRIQNPHNPQITKFTLEFEKKKSRLNFEKEIEIEGVKVEFNRVERETSNQKLNSKSKRSILIHTQFKVLHKFSRES